MTRSLVAMLATAPFAAGFAGPRLAPDQVALPFGIVTGNTNRFGHEFLGIPFAARPERFQPPKPWTANFSGGRLDATKYTPQCAQPAYGNVSTSEDCLHLNVYVPRRTAEQEQLPVMAWIHGGGLVTGSAMLSAYNASRLADEQQVVVVAMNYRLNVFGFQPVTADGSVVANNGFKDQQEALRWIQSHIEAFGGNRSHVTIFGESAGGQSVAVQTVSPLSRGLFHAAISESGDVASTRSLSTALDASTLIAKNLSCPTADLACLKTANATKLMYAFLSILTSVHAGSAVVGDEVLPATPVAMVQRGNFHAVPYVLGTNAQEGSFFVGATTLYTEQEVSCIVDAAVGASKAASILALYPLTVGADNRPVLVKLLTDLLFGCGTRELASARANASAPTWVYEFLRYPSCPLIWGSLTCAPAGSCPGAAHTYEIPYVFNNLAEQTARANASCRLANDDLTLAKTISGMWGWFARNGEPVPSWPRFDRTRQEVAKLDVGAIAGALDTESGYRRHQCVELERLGLGPLGEVATKIFPTSPSSLKCMPHHKRLSTYPGLYIPSV